MTELLLKRTGPISFPSCPRSLPVERLGSRYRSGRSPRGAVAFTILAVAVMVILLITLWSYLF
jgi:hypothetical protein